MSFDVVFLPIAIIVAVSLPARLVAGFDDTCAWRQRENLQVWCDIFRASPPCLHPVLSALAPHGDRPELGSERASCHSISLSADLRMCATRCKELGSGGTFSARPLA
jgi:hypothetical protein